MRDYCTSCNWWIKGVCIIVQKEFYPFWFACIEKYGLHVEYDTNV